MADVPPAPDTSTKRALALLVAIAVVDLSVALEPGLDRDLRVWWTGVGLAVVLVALTPVRRWPATVAAVLVVTTAVRLVAGADPADALRGGAVETLQALAGALVLTQVGRRSARLLRQRDLSLLVGAALLGAGITIGNAALAAGALDRGSALVLGASSAVSVLLLGSIVLLAPRARVRSDQVPELAAQTAALAAATTLAWGFDAPLGILPLLPLVWAALRFELGVAALELGVVSLAATVATSRGRGHFATDLAGDELGLLVLGFVAAYALITLPLALTVHHRADLLARVTADEELFRRTFTASPVGMVLLRQVDDGLVVDEVNPSATAILATTDEASVGRRFHDLVAPHDGPDHELAALLHGEVDAWRGDAVVLSRPGSRLEVSLTSVGRRDGARLFYAQLLDVTQEHDAHRRLVAALQLNDATLDTTACIILVTDASGTVVRINAAARDATGFADADLVGQQLWSSPLAPLSRSETEAMFVWPNRSGYPMVTERIGRTALGEPMRIVWNNNVVRDELGDPSYAVLTGIDVTAERASTGLVSHMLSASIATALIGVDGNGRITLANAGAGHMLGWSVAELEGRAFVELFDGPQLRHRTGAVGDRDSFLCLAGMIGETDESPAREWTWRTREGSALIVSMTLSVTEDLGAGRLGFLCVGRDVTAQREGQETLVAALEKERTAVERLRALDRAKDEFVSTVSHELRTPVTSIIGYTEMLRDGTVTEPSDDQLPVLERITRNSERLIAMCNDLLLLSGFDSDAAMGPRTRVDLRSCVAAAHDSFVDPSGARDVTVHVHPGTSPLEVAGDRSQLDRVVANLLGNALKFTPAGGRVDVELTDHEGRAVLVVRDTGIGIAPADHEAVFQRFFRTAEAQDKAIQGTGLGLPIVAAIVAAHDGEISLESEPGQGACFRVVLPLIDQRQPASAGVSPRG